MSSYLINIDSATEKSKYLVGLISEMAKSNENMTFEKISDNKDIFNMHPDNLTNEEAEIVVSTYEREAESGKGYTVEEARKKLDTDFKKW